MLVGSVKHPIAGPYSKQTKETPSGMAHVNRHVPHTVNAKGVKRCSLASAPPQPRASEPFPSSAEMRLTHTITAWQSCKVQITVHRLPRSNKTPQLTRCRDHSPKGTLCNSYSDKRRIGDSLLHEGCCVKQATVKDGDGDRDRQNRVPWPSKRAESMGHPAI